MYFKLKSDWYLYSFRCQNSGMTLAKKTMNDIVSQPNISEIMFWYLMTNILVEFLFGVQWN